MTIRSINSFATMGMGTGYSIYTQNLIRALNKVVPVNLYGRSQQTPDVYCQRMMTRSGINELADVSLNISGPSDALSFYGKHRAFITMWETTRIPAHQVKMLKTVDTLLATSNWMREVFIGNGIPKNKISVLRGGVDTRRFSPLPPYRGKEERPYTFLCVGKYERRKASREIVEAFLRAFKPEDQVQLHCKFTSPVTIPLQQIKEELAGVFKQYAPEMAAKVKLVADVGDIQNVYQKSDCLVMPSRAEGVGLPLLEAMACGVSYITTPYTAHIEYVKEGCGEVLPFQGLEDAVDPRYGIAPHTHGKWGIVRVDDIASAMIKMFQKPVEEKREASKKLVEHAQQFSWDLMAERLVKLLEERNEHLK